MAMKLLAVRKPRAARLAHCSKPFMASTKVSDWLSIISRTTALARSVIVRASFMNGSSRLRLAQLNQAFNSVRACCGLLLAAARA